MPRGRFNLSLSIPPSSDQCVYRIVTSRWHIFCSHFIPVLLEVPGPNLALFMININAMILLYLVEVHHWDVLLIMLIPWLGPIPRASYFSSFWTENSNEHDMFRISSSVYANFPSRNNYCHCRIFQTLGHSDVLRLMSPAIQKGVTLFK